LWGYALILLSEHNASIEELLAQLHKEAYVPSNETPKIDQVQKESTIMHIFDDDVYL
jgi:hypothetical protein